MGEDGFGARLETETTVAVADDGVVVCYLGFGVDEACEGGFELCRGDLAVH